MIQPENVGERISISGEQRGARTVDARTMVIDRFGMQVFSDEVTNPDGSTGVYNWINFPREAVLVFPLDNKGNIYLAKDHPYAINQTVIEAAGGAPEEGEEPQDAAIRIVKRELGIEVKSDSLVNLGTFQEITSRVNNKTHSFGAQVESLGEPDLNPGEEDLSRIVIAFDDAMTMVRNGVINNAVVAASLWKINDIVIRLEE